MLVYAAFTCYASIRTLRGRMLTYAGVCGRMLTYAGVCFTCYANLQLSVPHFTRPYADVCWRMLTYAAICRLCRAGEGAPQEPSTLTGRF